MLRTAAVAVLTLLGLAAPALAATTTKTVSGTLAHEYTPAGSSPPCLVASFYRWNEVAGTQRASATYLFNGGELRIAEKASPFDDRFNSFGLDVFAPAGQHQLYVSYASHQGTGPRDCSQDPELQKSRAPYSQTAQVTLVIDKAQTPACATAKKKLTAQKKAVTKLRAQLKKTKSPQAKRQLRRKLQTATKRETTLRKSVTRTC